MSRTTKEAEADGWTVGTKINSRQIDDEFPRGYLVTRITMPAYAGPRLKVVEYSTRKRKMMDTERIIARLLHAPCPRITLGAEIVDGGVPLDAVSPHARSIPETDQMSIMRSTVLAIADNKQVSSFFHSSKLAKNLVDRFVSGESLDDGLRAATDLAGMGIVTTLDQLGENVSTAEEATAAVDSYKDILRRMHAAQLEPNISVKLTMLGLDLGEHLAKNNIEAVLAVAKEVSGFVRIDMEGSAYTDITMRLFESLHAKYSQEVGIVIQTYLRRAVDDVKRMIEIGARVRLVKGAYAEPESVAFKDRGEIDSNYVHLMRLLLDGGTFPAIATHDPSLIDATRRYAKGRQIPLDRFEFQMLYGVRQDEQMRLREDGYGMRVYVPYGTEWYPYFTRRIAERPANALFVARQLFG